MQSLKLQVCIMIWKEKDNWCNNSYNKARKNLICNKIYKMWKLNYLESFTVVWNLDEIGFLPSLGSCLPRFFLCNRDVHFLVTVTSSFIFSSLSSSSVHSSLEKYNNESNTSNMLSSARDVFGMCESLNASTTASSSPSHSSSVSISLSLSFSGSAIFSLINLVLQIKPRFYTVCICWSVHVLVCMPETCFCESIYT